MFRVTRTLLVLMLVALAGCGGSRTPSADVGAPEASDGAPHGQARPVGAAPFTAVVRLDIDEPGGAAWWEEFELDYRAPDDWTMTYLDGATGFVPVDGEQVDAESVRAEVHTLPGTVVSFRDGVLVEQSPEGDEVRTPIEETEGIGLRPGPWFPHEGLARGAAGGPEGLERLRAADAAEGTWLALEDGTPLSYVSADGASVLQIMELSREGRRVDLSRHRDMVIEHVRSAGRQPR